MLSKISLRKSKLKRKIKRRLNKKGLRMMIMIVMMKITRIMIILRKITQVEVQKGSYVEVMMILLRIMRRILKRCIESI